METKKITITMQGIADTLGISRKTAEKLIGTPGFPIPVLVGKNACLSKPILTNGCRHRPEQNTSWKREKKRR